VKPRHNDVMRRTTRPLLALRDDRVSISPRIAIEGDARRA